MNRRAPYDFYGHRVLLSVKKKGESQRGSGSFVPSHLNDSPLRTTDEAIADLQSVGTALRKPSLKIYHIPTNKSIIPTKNKKSVAIDKGASPVQKVRAAVKITTLSYKTSPPKLDKNANVKRVLNASGSIIQFFLEFVKKKESIANVANAKSPSQTPEASVGIAPYFIICINNLKVKKNAKNNESID